MATPSTNSEYYQAQYDEVSAAENTLSDKYEQEIDEMGSMNSSDAMMMIMCSTLVLVSAFQEAEMMSSVVTLDALSTLETDENSMQSDFDDYQQDCANGDATAMQNDIDDAWANAEDIEAICDLPEFSSISGDVDNQIDSLFDTDSESDFNESTTQSYWNQAYDDDYSSGDSSSDSDDASADTMQSITNSFSALSTDFSNLSSSEQSEMQYYESEDQQIQGLDETLMQEWASEEMTMINNQITS